MNTEQIIKERLKVIPQDIREAIKSTDLASKFDQIVNKHSLHIDQNGALQTETMLVMIGLEPSKDFVVNLQRELEIPREKAQAIVDDVNKEIFMSIRSSIQSMQEEKEEEPKPKFVTPPPQPKIYTPIPKVSIPPIPASNSNLPPMVTPYVKPTFEQAGRFTIEKPPVGIPQYKKENEINKENILQGIEDPSLTMVDHLLTKPLNTAQAVEIKKPTTPKPAVDTKPYSTDPYREQI